MEKLQNLSADEKFEARFADWMSTENKKFANQAAVETYRRRTKRYYDIIKLKQPDRVPCILNVGGFVAQHTGVMHRDFFYDFQKVESAMARFYEDFDLEYQVNGNIFPGKALDRVGYKLYSWPGGKLPPNRPFQCDEKEYMAADEYDAFIADPSMFVLRRFMPRVFGALDGLKQLPNFIGSTELPTTSFMMLPMAALPLQEAFETLAEAGQSAQEWAAAISKIAASALEKKALPSTLGSTTKAPFDYIGDTMRGTRGIMLDMYRYPDKVIEACERLVPIAVDMAVSGADHSGIPVTFIPLHKGADTFMSAGNFEKFYWPSLKATILGIIEAGVVPFLFVEGAYNQRLDIIAEAGLPAGKTAWLFDQTDMAAAKEKIGGWACIGGNVSASLFLAGTPAQMDDAVKSLIDIAAPGGGYFIANSAILDDAKVENVHAYLKAAKTYGVY